MIVTCCNQPTEHVLAVHKEKEDVVGLEKTVFCLNCNFMCKGTLKEIQPDGLYKIGNYSPKPRSNPNCSKSNIDIKELVDASSQS